MPPLDKTAPLRPATAAHDRDAEIKAVNRFGSLLIADDNPFVLQALTSYFSVNWHVVGATNGEEALQQLRSFDPSAIISDYQMPLLDGVALAKATRSNPRLRNVPFFLLTATTFNKTDWQSLGVTKVVPKPCDLVRLDQEVRAALASRASE